MYSFQQFFLNFLVFSDYDEYEKFIRKTELIRQKCKINAKNLLINTVTSNSTISCNFYIF